MKPAKLDELIADLGYALLYLKEAHANGVGYGNLNRSRELISKVGDALIAERKKMPAPLKARTWTDVRREEVLKASAFIKPFDGLTKDQRSQLYDIVVNEFENWDGEEVEVSNIVKLMEARYRHHGLAPSRN